MTANQWKQKGNFIKLFNNEVFVIDEGKQNLKTMVILHGYPTSSYDYYKVLDRLTSEYRIIIHDHLGFGFSDKPKNYSYSLVEQADIALELWKQLGLTNFTLLAHDYGTSVATEIIARHNKKQLNVNIEKLILCNGSMHIELSQLRLIQKLLKNKITGKYVAKLSNEFIFSKNIRNVYFNKQKVSNEELKEMWQQLIHNDGKKVIHRLSNYINERYFFWYRWIGALKETEVPTKIVWAKNDPVAVFKIAELLTTEIKNNQLLPLENSGHFPMLESPDEWVELVLSN
ncbi:pimeloyl-ACP methyl ester carboxylesterase [Tenacibaculum skagerrakense]|uniref:Pimeloyl-ACP methyl ester carboxylesterase n=1 Tax=Tenacibaculum skagerrakense TaxID=186571 RepID=A0A4V2SLX4_9FLAO|nr:alpha/beta hydrolase [Tenacibaculum skagerrakense]TCP24716.1 pimeloyl-ACP methyl ester carboxylesterase [Tenacibaculum skagerrakense]